jgi:hypothetical protein
MMKSDAKALRVMIESDEKKSEAISMEVSQAHWVHSY